MMRNLVKYFALFIVILAAGCATTTTPGKATTQSRLINHEPSLSIRSVRDYSYDYHQVVYSTAHDDVYVICGDCPPKTKLDRELAEVPISVFWGKERVISAATVSQPGPAMELLQTKPLMVQPQPVLPDTKKASEGASVEIAKPLSQSKITSCVTTTVLFDLDSAVIKEQEKTKIRDSIDVLKEAQSVTVKGFTCDLGSKEHNDRLALERAKAVAAFLEDHGIRPKEVTGEGKCCYVSEDKSKNRRAEIYCLE